MNGATA